MLDSKFTLLDSIPDAVMLTDSNGVIAYANPAAQNMFGYCIDELYKQSINKLLPSHLRERHNRYIKSFSREPAARTMGTRINLAGQKRNGTLFPVDIMLNTTEYDKSFFIICVIRDMSTIKHTTDQLKLALDRESRLARHDPLTGVANRRLFEEHLNSVIKLSNRFGFIFTLVLLDIDNFKAMNDRFGHVVGDEVLIQAAKCIRNNLRSTDLVSRFGGDEFALLLEHSKVQTVRSTISKVHDALTQLFAQHEWPISVSLGAICCDSSIDSSNKLIDVVDRLLYEVKNSKKGQVRISLMSDS